MITYSFADIGKETLYQHLYECLKNDIIHGVLPEEMHLPSKRCFAKNLGVSVITVENAYAQLMAEGYIYSVPKKGFFVEKLPDNLFYESKENLPKQEEIPEHRSLVDFASNRNNPDNFPFSIWAKLSKETMANDSHALMTPPPVEGVYELRYAICKHLRAFRGMNVQPSQIIIGAGTEYLYSLLIQLFGSDKVYGVENPGYKKLYQIYQSYGVRCNALPLDEKGINMKELGASDTDVLHISPAHHFPTGIVTPIRRRYELLAWASESERRYIIEDDFDSEFRMVGKSIPMLQSIDGKGKVIYMNTFSKSLTSTIRISYMVLPPRLVEQFRGQLGFYANTVSTFEQYTLARFISQGYYEKHINRMRTHYRNLQSKLTEAIKNGPYKKKVRIEEEEAGLHFLIKLDTKYSDHEIMKKAKEAGYRILLLSDCYIQSESGMKKEETKTLVVNYSAMGMEEIQKINTLLGILIS